MIEEIDDDLNDKIQLFASRGEKSRLNRDCKDKNNNKNINSSNRDRVSLLRKIGVSPDDYKIHGKQGKHLISKLNSQLMRKTNDTMERKQEISREVKSNEYYRDDSPQIMTRSSTVGSAKRVGYSATIASISVETRMTKSVIGTTSPVSSSYSDDNSNINNGSNNNNNSNDDKYKNGIAIETIATKTSLRSDNHDKFSAIRPSNDNLNESNDLSDASESDDADWSKHSGNRDVKHELDTKFQVETQTKVVSEIEENKYYDENDETDESEGNISDLDDDVTYNGLDLSQIGSNSDDDENLSDDSDEGFEQPKLMRQKTFGSSNFSRVESIKMKDNNGKQDSDNNNKKKEDDSDSGSEWDSAEDSIDDKWIGADAKVVRQKQIEIEYGFNNSVLMIVKSMDRNKNESSIYCRAYDVFVAQSILFDVSVFAEEKNRKNNDMYNYITNTSMNKTKRKNRSKRSKRVDKKVGKYKSKMFDYMKNEGVKPIVESNTSHANASASVGSTNTKSNDVNGCKSMKKEEVCDSGESFKSFSCRMKKLFKSDNSKVSKNKFVRGLSNSTPSVSPIYGQKIFSKLDTNNTGYVSINTMYDWIRLDKKDNDYGTKMIKKALSNRD